MQQDASPPAPDGGPPSRGAIAWFVRNRVAANLLLFAISLAGLLTIRGVPQELVPETSPSTLTVSTVWPGSGASVIEDSVLVPMEEALRDIGGIREISGTARDGIGTLTVELEYWADFQGVSDEVRERLEAITSLPDGAEDPVIGESSTRRLLLRVAVHGPADERALTEAAHRVREDLSRVPGVAAVETASGRDYEIAIEVSEDVLSRFGLTFDQVAAAIRRAGDLSPDGGDGVRPASGAPGVAHPGAGGGLGDLEVITTRSPQCFKEDLMGHQRNSMGARWALTATLPLLVIGLATPAHGAVRPGDGDLQEPQQTGERESEETEEQPVAARFTDQVVVSASRVEQEIVNAPAAVTVIGSEQLEAQPGADHSEVLRQAPGVNVTRMTNSSYTVTSRSSSTTGARHQLVLVDGRPVHQEYGAVAWSMLSGDLDNLNRIEVVNGPASAVWGANAMTGVINLITKAPRDTPGTTLDLRFGTFDRNVTGNPMDAGNTLSGALTHARAVSDTFAYRFSVSFRRSDAFARPVGELPNGSGTAYPAVEGLESRTPKVDFRADWDTPGNATVTVSGGYGGNEGVFYTALGPFGFEPGSRIAWGRAQYRRNALEIGAFVNSSRMDTRSLLARSMSGQLLAVQSDQDTYDLSVKDTRLLGGRHVLSYGGNIRLIRADLDLAPGAEDRNEQGFYVNDEIFLGNRWRWIAGVRADRVSVLDEFVLSPRTTLMFKPAPDQAFRVSYNQAFRSPSLRSSYADFGMGNALRFDLGPFVRTLPGAGRIPEALLPAPVGFFSPLYLAGNPELVAERLFAYEVGWAGALNDWVGASVSVYVNERRDVIDSTVTGLWSTRNPPPGWNRAFAEVQQFIAGLARRLPPGTLPRPVAAIAVNPAALVDILGATTGLELPSTLGWVNRESIRDSGFEVGLNGRRGRVGGYVNYSWQAEPEAKGFDGEAVSIPAAHRLNAGFDATSGPWTFGASLNYTDRAYWTDVLSERYHGWTEAFTMVGASARLRLLDGRIQPSVQVLNLLNQEVQNHIFGDVLRRQIMGAIRFRF